LRWDCCNFQAWRSLGVNSGTNADAKEPRTDDGLHGEVAGRRVDEVHVMAVLDGNAGCVSEPLGVVESSALGDGRAALFA
jgi:hypothetical protein